MVWESKEKKKKTETPNVTRGRSAGGRARGRARGRPVKCRTSNRGPAGPRRSVSAFVPVAHCSCLSGPQGLSETASKLPVPLSSYDYASPQVRTLPRPGKAPPPLPNWLASGKCMRTPGRRGLAPVGSQGKALRKRDQPARKQS